MTDQPKRKMFWEMERAEKRACLEERAQRGSQWGERQILDLDEKYPDAGMLEQGCISAEIGPGWAKHLEPCLEVIGRLGCKVTQVKQKFCVLTVYWEGPEWYHRACSEWLASGKIGPDPSRLLWEIKQVVDLMAHRSKFTCELCGGRDDTEQAGHQASGRRLCKACSASELERIKSRA